MSSPAPANVSIVTLGVADLVRSTAFYEALGWVNSTASQVGVRFLIGADIVLGLYPVDKLAEDAGVENAPAGFRGVTLARNLESEAAVDAFFDRALDAGGVRVKAPERVFWGGYSGYFADPDGHLWEVAHNPFFSGNAATGRLDLEARTEPETEPETGERK